MSKEIVIGPKEINQNTVDAYESAALEGLKHIRAFLAYEGSNPIYLQKAKQASVPVNGFVKLVGTQTNRMAVEQVMDRRAKVLEG